MCVCVCVRACVRACVRVGGRACVRVGVRVLLTNCGCLPFWRGGAESQVCPRRNCRVWQLLLPSCSLVHGAYCCFPNLRGIFFDGCGRNVVHSSADSPSGSMAGVEHFGIWQNIETETMLRWRPQYGNNSEIPSSLVS